jgi:hypothetical protein
MYIYIYIFSTTKEILTNHNSSLTASEEIISCMNNSISHFSIITISLPANLDILLNSYESSTPLGLYIFHTSPDYAHIWVPSWLLDFHLPPSEDCTAPS